MFDSGESSNYTEYNYDKIPSREDKIKRGLYICGAAVVIIALAAVCVISKMLLYFAPFVAAFGIYLARFLFRYFQHEYKYTLDRSVFTMVRFYGKSKPHPYFSLDVKDAEAIVPYSEESAAKYPEDGFDIVHTSYVSKDSRDLYMIIWNKDGKKVLSYFEASKKALKMMKFYNPLTVVKDDLRH